MYLCCECGLVITMTTNDSISSRFAGLRIIPCPLTPGGHERGSNGLPMAAVAQATKALIVFSLDTVSDGATAIPCAQAPARPAAEAPSVGAMRALSAAFTVVQFDADRLQLKPSLHPGVVSAGWPSGALCVAAVCRRIGAIDPQLPFDPGDQRRGRPRAT